MKIVILSLIALGIVVIGLKSLVKSFKGEGGCSSCSQKKSCTKKDKK